MSARTSLLVSGALLAAAGSAATVSGGAVLALTGTDSTMSSARAHLASSGTAVRTADGDLDTGWADGLGPLRLSVTATAGRPVFVGIGPAAAVDRYLAGAAIDTVEDLDVRPLRVSTEHRGGTARPAPPGSQSFWTAQSDGTTSGTASWLVEEGSQRIVVMNADGSPGVDADVSAAVRVEHLTGVAVGLLAGGLAVLVAGVLLLLRARRRPDAAPRRPPVAPGPITDRPQEPAVTP